MSSSNRLLDALLLIAIALVGLGIYRALYLPGMLVAPQVPLLLVVFSLQAVFGIAAGVAVWRRASWAPLAIGLLGASIVATALVEVFLGVIAALRAVLDAGLAVLVSVLLIAFVRNRGERMICSRDSAGRRGRPASRRARV
jgi:hypothetical protein